MAKEITKILWVSTNPTLSAEQLSELLRIFHNKIQIKTYTEQIELNLIVAAGMDCDVWAVDLPTEMLVELMKPQNHKRPIIRPKYEEIEQHGLFFDESSGPSRSRRKAVFCGWECIKKFDIVVESL